MLCLQLDGVCQPLVSRHSRPHWLFQGFKARRRLLGCVLACSTAGGTCHAAAWACRRQLCSPHSSCIMRRSTCCRRCQRHRRQPGRPAGLLFQVPGCRQAAPVPGGAGLRRWAGRAQQRYYSPRAPRLAACTIGSSHPQGTQPARGLGTHASSWHPCRPLPCTVQATRCRCWPRPSCSTTPRRATVPAVPPGSRCRASRWATRGWTPRPTTRVGAAAGWACCSACTHSRKSAAHGPPLWRVQQTLGLHAHPRAQHCATCKH